MAVQPELDIDAKRRKGSHHPAMKLVRKSSAEAAGMEEVMPVMKSKRRWAGWWESDISQSSQVEIRTQGQETHGVLEEEWVGLAHLGWVCFTGKAMTGA